MAYDSAVDRLADGPRREVGSTRLRPPTLAVGLALLLGSLLVGVSVGPARLSAGAVALEMLDRLPLVSAESGLSELQQTILWHVRMPRVVLGALVGALLASCGAAYQGVFRNPLADPYLLGVAAGAGLGATIVIVYGPPSGGAGRPFLPVAAFVGGAMAVTIAYALGGHGQERALRRDDRARRRGRGRLPHGGPDVLAAATCRGAARGLLVDPRPA